MTEPGERPPSLRRSLARPANLWLFFRVAAWALTIPVLFRLLSLPTLMRLISPKMPDRSPDAKCLDKAHLVNSYIAVILRQNPDNIGRMCLKRSLVLYRFLRLEKCPARFLVGVRKEEGKLVGHSWIEVDGERFLDSQPDQTYIVTYSFPET